MGGRGGVGGMVQELGEIGNRRCILYNIDSVYEYSLRGIGGNIG